mmetsp:Transcript_137934/g.384689  ORF Transcript_137934/g.384689 Transcript_137934/m.384689 type:complete len:246 (+) Transcript_137934:221-958(+)
MSMVVRKNGALTNRLVDLVDVLEKLLPCRTLSGDLSAVDGHLQEPVLVRVLLLYLRYPQHFCQSILELFVLLLLFVCALRRGRVQHEDERGDAELVLVEQDADLLPRERYLVQLLPLVAEGIHYKQHRRHSQVAVEHRPQVHHSLVPRDVPDPIAPNVAAPHLLVVVAGVPAAALEPQLQVGHGLDDVAPAPRADPDLEPVQEGRLARVLQAEHQELEDLLVLEPAEGSRSCSALDAARHGLTGQ